MNDERLLQTGRQADAEGNEFDRDMEQVRDFDHPLQLAAHHLSPADDAAGYRLVAD